MTKEAGQKLAGEELLSKLMKYCAYRDRCESEVWEKLHSFDVSDELKEEVFYTLQQQSFVDEERFARMFTRSKFNQNRWGKLKIQRGLQEKQVNEGLIQTALAEEIEHEAYTAVLSILLQQKEASIKARNHLEKKNKLAQFAIRKGYEPNLVWQEVNRMI